MADMDVDLEELYDEDEGELYDTPCQVFAPRVLNENQHHSSPSLRGSTLKFEDRVHNSAPNLENDVNQCNVGYTKNNQAKVDANGNIETISDEDEVYMNTTFNAEEKIVSRNSSMKKLNPDDKVVERKTSPLCTVMSVDQSEHANPLLDHVKAKLTEPETFDNSSDGFYMTPPPSNTNGPPVDRPLPAIEPVSPGFYMTPPTFKSESSDPPERKTSSTLPPRNSLQSEHTEPSPDDYFTPTEDDTDNYYEGIGDDANGDNFYEGIPDDSVALDDNLYEGIPDETIDDNFYEGLGDDDVDEDNVYEGLPEIDESYYEGLPGEGPDVFEPIAILNQDNSPYVPPKPPPVPNRNRSSMPPLPLLPDYALNIQKPPSCVPSIPTNPPPFSPMKPIPAETDIAEIVLPILLNDDEGIDENGFYDGIDLEDGSSEDDYDGFGDNMMRTYSMRVKKSVKNTRRRTSSQIGQIKKRVSETSIEVKGKWKDSKTRMDMKNVWKESKAKTESIYSSGVGIMKKKKKKRSGEGKGSGEGSNSLDSKKSTYNGSDTRRDTEDSIPSNMGSTPGADDFKSLPRGSCAELLEDDEKFHDLESSYDPSPGSSRVVSVHSGEERYSANLEIHAEAIANETTALLSSDLVPPELKRHSHPHPQLQVVNNTQNMGQRHKILQKILDHEYRYIMSLKDVMKVYAQPLQNQSQKLLIDPSRAQEIFFRIPEITVHHEFFYEQLRRRSMTWTRHQAIGDILIQLFHKPTVFGAYSSYIDNYNHAVEILRETRSARPAFSKFLDKLHSKANQQSLEELIYAPVEHIPRYLDLLKELMDNTGQTHPDYTYLYMAKDEVESLSKKLESRRKQAEETFAVLQLEKKVAGLTQSLMVPQRCLIMKEKVSEIDIMTERVADRWLFVMSDLVLCVRPITRSSSSVMNSQTAEYQYLWDCLLTDLRMENNNESSNDDADENNTQEATKTLKEDLDILEQIDELRKQLYSSYSGLRLDKLPEIKSKLKSDIAKRADTERHLKGRMLDLVRPVNNPCTGTQFHRFIFNTVKKRTDLAEQLKLRQQKLQHTKDLDWCQVGDEQTVLSTDSLALLLPTLKHMTPIGLTTTSNISVECAVASADFTCPVTEDILYRIIGTTPAEGDEQFDSYINVEEDGGDIPITVPVPPPVKDTPLYDEELTVPVKQVINGEVAKGNRIIMPSSKSPFTVSTAVDAPISIPVPSPVPEHAPVSHSVPTQSSLAGTLTLDHQIQKEFNYDSNNASEENMYETPDEIGLLMQRKKMQRSSSVDGLRSLSGLTLDPPPQSLDTPPPLPSREPIPIDQFSIVESGDFTVTEDSVMNRIFDNGNGARAVDCRAEGIGGQEVEIEIDEEGVEELKELREADDVFNVDELTESREVAPDSLTNQESVKESILVDGFGQLYTDKITSILSSVGCSNQFLDPSVEVNTMSLLELNSDDEDTIAPSGLPEVTTLLSTTVETDSKNASLTSNKSSLQSTESLSSSSKRHSGPPDSMYENVTSQKPRTKVVRRHSSKRSITRKPSAVSRTASHSSDEWNEPEFYENLNEDEEFYLRSSDVFLCGHGSNGAGEIIVLRLTEPTPHVVFDVQLEGHQVLCCYKVPGRKQTLWIGTQDEKLLVYQMSDPSVTLFENELSGGPVTCISHVRDSVFVGTAEGHLYVFTRESSINEWGESAPHTKRLGTQSICAMIPIGDCMWVSCGNQIYVISQRSVTVEHLFSTHNNVTAQVYRMVSSGSGVWLAIRNSPVIRLFHAKTGEHLQDFDVSTFVHHLFTGSQCSGRRRKAENIRVTTLMASPATGALWIGTSSGVIIVVPIVGPPLAPKTCGPPFLSYHGHYDGVRFLIQAESKIQKVIRPGTETEDEEIEEIISPVVISGGKGVEDYRNPTTANMTSSHELHDSSYLIIWHYPMS